jgi:putative redox protein
MSALTAKMTWKGGLKFEGVSTFGYPVVADVRKDVGGNEEGARPTELLLYAVASCTGVDVIRILQKQRQKIDSLEIEVVGHQREEYPKAFAKLEVKYIARGADLDEKKLARAIELSEKKYCSVSATVTCSGEVVTSFEILDD